MYCIFIASYYFHATCIILNVIQKTFWQHQHLHSLFKVCQCSNYHYHSVTLPHLYVREVHSGEIVHHLLYLSWVHKYSSGCLSQVIQWCVASQCLWECWQSCQLQNRDHLISFVFGRYYHIIYAWECLDNLQVPAGIDGNWVTELSCSQENSNIFFITCLSARLAYLGFQDFIRCIS